MEIDFTPLPAGTLVLVCLGAIALLLFLILVAKWHALVSLVTVSIATAFATGIPTASILDVLLGGFGNTLGEIGLLIAFGVMFARLIESSGGSSVLSEALIGKLGEKRAPLALGIASLLFGITIFFDAAFMVMLPLYLAVARRLQGSLLLYVLPGTAALSVMHMTMPPHPGIVTAGTLLGADIGLVMLFGLVVALPSWFLVGHLMGSWMGRQMVLPIPDILFGGPRVESSSTSSDDAAPEGNGSSGSPILVETVKQKNASKVNPPSVGTLLALIFLPLVLILLNTGTTMMVKTGTASKELLWVQLFQFAGAIPVALLITVITASYVLGTRRGRGKAAIEDMLENSLKPIASVLVVVGAGGMFAEVLTASGIGDALAGTLNASGLPLPVALFLVCAIMSAAVGSTTIAITTGAGLLGTTIAAAGLDPIQMAALVLVMAGGSGVLPHVNDTGFWLIGRLLNMSVTQTFKTWTVLKTLLGVAVAIFATLLYAAAGVLS
ncbi:gluconate:H+ symporter [Glutamicibacter sp. FBE19]|uniref:GntP family permease n=1 Tax=Glutamicibacter sp. FBE19 TaxID=2761534 RepID=UPI0018968192|nr:gluconate:H+ symporter [Glutamicibacter sp. FBE19]MBF6670491.1 GntP family permease [Glutamicibacter sp. FBE19]